jgi:hypothetical protein
MYVGGGERKVSRTSTSDAGKVGERDVNEEDVKKKKKERNWALYKLHPLPPLSSRPPSHSQEHRAPPHAVYANVCLDPSTRLMYFFRKRGKGIDDS